MRLLPKNEVNKIKAQERKNEIDTGISLAQSVDKLRETFQNEKSDLINYRETTLRQIKVEIDSLLEDRDNLLKWNTEARKQREEILKVDVSEVKKELANLVNSEQEKHTVNISRESLKIDEQSLEKEKEKIALIIAQSKQNEIETEKANNESVSLREMAQRHYEMAQSEHSLQTEEHEKSLKDLQEQKESYENGVKILEIERNEVKEKESELIIREKHLASQQVALRIAMEEVKKYGTS